MNLPNHTIRTSRLTRPEGIGAIIDVGGESLMALPLERWTRGNFLRYLEPLPESALSRKLNLQIKYLKSSQGLALDVKGGRIPVIRFPTWFHCRHKECNNFFSVRTINRNAASQPVSENEKGPVKCPRCKKPANPFRFVVACENSHLQDIDWIEYVHKGTPGQCRPTTLKLQVSGKNLGDWESLVLTCRDCRKSKNLRDLSVKGEKCRGKQPWEEAPERSSKIPCPKRGRLVLRTASNVYYPVVKTAIDVDVRQSAEITDLYNTIVDFMALTASNKDEKIVNGFREKIRLNKDEWHFTKKEGSEYEYITPGFNRIVERIIDRIIDRNPGYSHDDYEKIREELERWGHSYSDRILKGEVEPERSDDLSTSSHNDDELFNKELTILNNPDRSNANKKDFEADAYETNTSWGLLSNLMPKVTRIYTLREVNALIGFTRIYSSDRIDDTDEDKERPRFHSIILESKTPRWTIGYENFGEGFFIHFDSSILKKWSHEDHFGVDSHLTSTKKIEYALHTFSHILIRQLEYASGYSATSLKERLYIPKEDSSPDNPGILIYTASGDSEGALGGLVRQSQAKNLLKNIVDALSTSEWCSADPVCSETKSGWDHITNTEVNMAVCHACCFIPETACINNNLFLDRKILKSLLNHIGFM
jgi:hypothetical protein